VPYPSSKYNKRCNEFRTGSVLAAMEGLMVQRNNIVKINITKA